MEEKAIEYRLARLLDKYFEMKKEGGYLMIEKFVEQEIEKAREEGYKKGREEQQHLDGLLYGTTVATTTTLEEGWILKDKKKVEEELSKLTTK